MTDINKLINTSYSFEYTELAELDEDNITKYYQHIKKSFSKKIQNWDIKQNTYWVARFYIAIKYIYSASVLISSLEHAEETNLQITIPYLTYYSLLTCSRALILTDPERLEPLNELKKLTHTQIIKQASNIIQKLNHNKKEDFFNIINVCKENRELFSYKFPATGLKIIEENKKTSNQYYDYCRLFCEIAQLNSSILDVLLNETEYSTTFDIDGNYDSDIYHCFDYGNGKIDNDDYYRTGYISRKMKRPLPLNLMATYGMSEDFFGAWCNPDDNSQNSVYNPDENWSILFPFS